MSDIKSSTHKITVKYLPNNCVSYKCIYAYKYLHTYTCVYMFAGGIGCMYTHIQRYTLGSPSLPMLPSLFMYLIDLVQTLFLIYAVFIPAGCLLQCVLSSFQSG